MAFSYSDENFTVVGNLCFVHIKTTTKDEVSISIPPALADRMLIDEYYILATNSFFDDSSNNSSAPLFVEVKDKKITFNPAMDITYINFFFPINSNK